VYNSKSERLDFLKKQISRHNRLYYLENNPEISDQDYDLLVKEYENLLEENLLDNDLDIGSDLLGQKRFKHDYPMLSLSNSYSFDDLDAFDKRLKKYCEPNYFAEAKLDGLSLSLKYRKGKILRALTRGDGLYGENITEAIKTIDSIPKEIIKDEDFEIRGEILMPISSFKELNRKRSVQAMPLFANPRNAAAGSIRHLDISEIKNRKLDCFFYHINDSFDQKSSLEKASSLGFKINEYTRYCVNIEEVKDFIDYFKNIRNTLDYQTDGIVIKLNNYADRIVVGETNKSPRWAIAFKYPSVQAVAKIKGVSFQVGKTGIITPVAHFDPIELNGSIISNASLYNFSNVLEKDIRINDYVFLEKGGDVIPKIIKVIESRRENSLEIEPPKECPSCYKNLIFQNKYLICLNRFCKDKILRQLSFFVSKEAINISGLGPKILEKLIANEIIKCIPDIYEIKETDLLHLEGFDKKSANNILNSISNSKKTEYSRVLYSLGIRHLGIVGAKILSELDIDLLINSSLDDIKSFDGIGEITANSVYDFLHDSYNIAIIDRLKSHGLNFRKENSLNINSKLFQKKICITGSLNIARDVFIKSIESMGAIFSSSITKTLDILVLGSNPGSKLLKAKKLKEQGHAIEIISEKEFNKRFF
jgi:DNA ligase (NAD+)